MDFINKSSRALEPLQFGTEVVVLYRFSIYKGFVFMFLYSSSVLSVKFFYIT